MPQKTGAPEPMSACHRTLDLKRYRKKAGISLEEIAERTKISVRFLRAIEDQDFDKLPGGIFRISYMRQYAAAIGFDVGELLALHECKMNPAVENSSQPETPSRSLLNRWLGVPAPTRTS